jgi:PfpI family intracellular protease
VFGCVGSTNVVVPAIEWAVDPNKDGNFADHLDVINMSLGSSFSGPDDPDAIASDNAALAGVAVAVSAGNSGDTYFISGGPTSSSRVLSTAATVDGGQFVPAILGNAPAGVAGKKFWAAGGGFGPQSFNLTGDVVQALGVERHRPGAREVARRRMSGFAGQERAVRRHRLRSVLDRARDGKLAAAAQRVVGSSVAARARMQDFDALVIPGGHAPDRMRLRHAMIDLAREAMTAGKPVAAIGHGPQLLISAGALRGRTLTCWPSIAIDVKNAGGLYVDKPVVEDGNLITSRKPDDVPMFSEAIIKALAK